MTPRSSSRWGTLGLLLLLAVLTAVAGDSTGPASSSSVPRTHASPAEGSRTDPESQKRMAIFHFNEGNKFLRAGDWDPAVRQYEMALHHDPALHPASVNLSTAYLRAGRYSQAQAVLRRLQAAAPTLPELHYNLACLYALTGRAPEGLRALKEAVRLGYPHRSQLYTDPDLNALRLLPAFQEWIQTP